jgi:hypothetical protein
MTDTAAVSIVDVTSPIGVAHHDCFAVINLTLFVGSLAPTVQRSSVPR